MAVNWNAYYTPQNTPQGIITGNPALASLQQRYAQEAKDKSDEENKFNASLAKMNFGGAKPADYGDLQSGYNAIVQAHQAARAERDPTKKGELNQQVNALQNDLLYKTAQSKEANSDIHKYSDLPLTHPDNIHPDFIKNLSGLANTSTFAPTYQDAKNTFENNAFLPKSVDWNKYLQGVATPLIKSGNTSQIIKDPTTGELVTQTRKTNSLDKTGFASAIIDDLKDPVKLRQAQGAFGGNSPVETAQNMINSSYDRINGSLDNSTTQGTPFETGATKSNRILSREQELALWKQKHGLGASGTQLTPAQIMLTGMQQQVPGSGEKMLSLLPKGQYGNQTPAINIDKTGNHVFQFPQQVDQKAIEDNKQLKQKWARENPDEPYDETATGFKLKPEIVKPAKTYSLNPTSPNYAAQGAQMISEQGGNLTRLNQAEGIKGHGQIPIATPKGTQPTVYKVKGKDFKAESVQKAAKASGMSVNEYLKEVNR